MSRPRRRIVEQPEIPPKVWAIAKGRAKEAIRILQHSPEIAFIDLLGLCTFNPIFSRIKVQSKE